MNAFESLGRHLPLFAEARGDIEVSFEFFPPKTETLEQTPSSGPRPGRRRSTRRRHEERTSPGHTIEVDTYTALDRRYA